MMAGRRRRMLFGVLGANYEGCADYPPSQQKYTSCFDLVLLLIFGDFSMEMIDVSNLKPLF
jgi:hypothetical protein